MQRSAGAGGQGPKGRQVNLKKILNKKKWREQRYNNKAKFQKWENIKRNQMLKQYNKELKKSGYNVNAEQLKERDSKAKDDFKHSLMKAQLQYQKIQEEKNERRKQRELDMQKREEALKAYKEKKAMRHQKLFHKNGYGKASMKGRLELLLEKIEKQYGNSEYNT